MGSSIYSDKAYKSSEMDFDFINDETFRNLLKRDYAELEICLENNASKSVLILSGSIIESILIEYFISYPPEGINSTEILKSDLNQLIKLAFEYKLITETTKDLSAAIRNYRNLIHPGREVRKNEKFNPETANVAKNVLILIIREIKENYIKNLGYTAKDIIRKLENDSVSPTIFEKLILKIHKNERIKLYEYLIDYELKTDESQVERLINPKKYIELIKPHIERQVIEKQLLKLVDEIERGGKNKAMKYFNMLHEDLNYMEDSNKELILLYVLNVLKESGNHIEEFEKYQDENLFSVFGTHLSNPKVKKEFLEMVRGIVEIYQDYKNKDYILFNAYDQIMNSLDKNKKTMVNKYVINSTHGYMSREFFDGYSEGNYLPF